jgi:hypothetical protein
LLGLEVHDAVGVLHDGAGLGAGLQAARVFAVHAAVLADQPLQLALLVDILVKAHQRPALGREIARVVVDAEVLAHIVAQIVPFAAGHLAGLAANADADVDEFGDLGLVVACGAAGVRSLVAERRTISWDCMVMGARLMPFRC